MEDHHRTEELSPILAEIVDLEPLDETRQLGHGDEQHVATQKLQKFRKCTVSTKITDLRKCHFRDGRTDGMREACIVFFVVEFGQQMPRSQDRIKDLRIDLTVDEVEQDEEQEPTNPQSASVDQDLMAKRIFPRKLTGPTEERSITNSLGLDIKPVVRNISVAGATFDRQSSYHVPYHGDFKVSPAGIMGFTLTIAENSLYQDGLPDVLRFALLVQTDGLPFEIGLKFFGSSPGVLGRIGGKLSLNIGRRYLWVRRSDEAEGVEGIDDADSVAFQSWVKGKTFNGWAVVSEYDF